ncbi:MAG: lipoxygenase family protein [Acidimicrobiales bacterium]
MDGGDRRPGQRPRPWPPGDGRHGPRPDRLFQLFQLFRLARLRFWMYRQIVAVFVWTDFKTQRVLPLRPPAEGKVEFRPYAESFPNLPLAGLYDPQTFPATEKARLRLLAISVTKAGMRLAQLVCPASTPPVPNDIDALVRAVYPRLFRSAWPHPPSVPEGLAACGEGTSGPDVIAELAVRGPFASYLRRADTGGYEVDLSWMLDYPAKEGFARPGARASLETVDGRLRTVATSGSPAALLAGWNEDLTTFRHNISVHLALLTPVALATTNHLGPSHPLRRLLQPCFQTVLIGNRELATLQLSGRRGFSVRIFSHDPEVLTDMASQRLCGFDIWDFEPPTHFARRATSKTPFPYPYRDNVLALYDETLQYVASYVALYYAADSALDTDREVKGWLQQLDRLVINGISMPPDGLTRDWVSRLCATVIHTSTVEHDYLNNVAWDYSTLSWMVPVVVPLSGEAMDQRRAFDLLATLIGTWKRYNMLLTADLPSLALDEAARRLMQQWIDRLGTIQREMTGIYPDPGWYPGRAPQPLSFPANLNLSISN